jgi:hypothetical protein
MVIWVTARSHHFCGRCSADIEEGQVMALHQLPNLSRRLIRCPTCEGHPLATADVSEDVLPVLPHTSRAPRMTRIGEIAQAEREPGQEG